MLLNDYIKLFSILYMRVCWLNGSGRFKLLKYDGFGFDSDLRRCFFPKNFFRCFENVLCEACTKKNQKIKHLSTNRTDSKVIVGMAANQQSDHWHVSK